MFLKPFKVKSNNQLKASEKKQLKDDIKRAFSSLTDEDIDNIFGKKDLVSVLKIETAAHAIVQVYVVNKRAIAFVYEKVFFPTVYFLWQYPDILLTFTTHPPVLSKLTDGAHLMLPGVVHPTLSLFSQSVTFAANTLACVNLTTNKAAVAVGVTAQSSIEMIRSNNKGKGIIIYHVVGDKLCTLENLPCLSVPEKGVPEWLKENNDVNIENLCLEENSENDEKKPETSEVEQDLTDKEDNANASEEVCEVIEPTVEEVDKLFCTSFLSAIKYSKNLNTPILTSTFYKVFMVPACPPGKTLDIKKSSYKKLSNFLQSMTELGIIKVEEQKKGVDCISEINREHSSVATFNLDPAERPQKKVEEVDDISQPMVVEAHSVTAIVLPLFAEFGFTKGSVISNSDIRKYVTEYIKKHQLQNEEDKSCVKLNPALKNICPNENSLTWQKLIEKVYNSMSACYKITCGDTEIIRKGKLEAISITVAKRSGNKKVTLVDNLEIFGINIDEVASACQRGVAASTNINRSQTSKKTDQLQIQGNQVLFVFNLLQEKYKVPKKFIKGLEFAPKKK
ncbi:hypothetical protein ILUMI_21203 [Ignelater luminosus]|uniref:Eukaryotic translation initiation factor 2D n=1 Tax=Ignelater luminosus TaxID=2038154 RepID=A0A8K0G1M7_IGNLU|nr:hypothetical protein ILUMI_21203 [Ignelater luminosus]